MLFNSVNFLIFFPIVVLLYFLVPHKIRWVWLLFASFYFYMCWNVRYVILLSASIAITYLTGIWIRKAEKYKNVKKRIFYKKLWITLSFLLNLGILSFFKYFPFVLKNLNLLVTNLGMELIPAPFEILLPVGISFYTFQALGYNMDVYRGEIEPEKNIFKYALFVSFFPQIAAGPIGRAKSLLPQIKETHSFDYDNMKNGFLLMLWGFFQKIVIADRIAILVNQVFNHYQNYEGFEIALASILFSIQIYCDFSGYSLIAKGAAQVMGFHLMNNFKQPYFAVSLQDFWKRWHISLSSWFRDYLYIPLGGSRCSNIKKYRNILITFLLSGLWHGASWNYVAWGGLHGVFQIFGNLLKPFKERFFHIFHIRKSCFSFRLGQILCTFVLVDITWIFFRAPGLRAAFSIIKRMFSEFNIWILFDGSIFNLGLDSIEFIIMIIAIIILGIGSYLQTRINVRETLGKQLLLFRWLFYYTAIFVILIFGIYGPGYDSSQFFYFQF